MRKALARLGRRALPEVGDVITPYVIRHQVLAGRSIFAPPGRGKSNASGQIDCAEPAEPLNTRCFEKQSKTIKMISGGARPGDGRKAGTPNRRKHSAPHYLDSAASHLSRDS